MIASNLLKIYINICLNNTGLTTEHSGCRNLLRIYLYQIIPTAGLLKSKLGFGSLLVWFVSRWFISLRPVYPIIWAIWLHSIYFYLTSFCDFMFVILFTFTQAPIWITRLYQLFYNFLMLHSFQIILDNLGHSVYSVALLVIYASW
jgi:hypothetical protein